MFVFSSRLSEEIQTKMLLTIFVEMVLTMNLSGKILVGPPFSAPENAISANDIFLSFHFLPFSFFLCKTLSLRLRELSTKAGCGYKNWNCYTKIGFIDRR